MAEPDILPGRFLVVLANPMQDRLQFGRLGKVLEAIGQAKHLQLAFRYCCEERVRPVFGHDPNERSEPRLVHDLRSRAWRRRVYVRTPPHFEAIRATAKHQWTSSPWPLKSAIVEAVAHLSIVMMESYALKELSEPEMLRVEKHVASCPKCRDHLEGELGWSAAMRSPFMAKVRKIVKAEKKRPAQG
jgi:hypothetical protein